MNILDLFRRKKPVVPPLYPVQPKYRLTESETDGFWLHIDLGARKVGIHLETKSPTVIDCLRNAIRRQNA